jgi:nifR3 family TIM-barrel protein
MTQPLNRLTKHSFRLGNIVPANHYILAPMAGVSEQPFREIAFELGAGLAPTELVSANGLIRASSRTSKYLKHGASEQPFVVQIFGGEPELMAQAAVMVKQAGADVIDINMGCPVPKVTKSGAGSGLLCDPPRAQQIVRLCKEATGLPVSAKIRAGWDSSRLNFVEMGLALQEVGVAAVALHPRTRAQGYAGKADWTRIAKLKDALKHTPVIGNGDVVSVADAKRMQAETNCDAVMIGRGALGNPWIFRQLLGGLPPTPEERCELVLRHFDAHIVFVEKELPAVREFRRHWGWYSHGLAGSAAFRSEINKLESAAAARALAERFFSGAAQERTMQSVDDAEVDYKIAYG